MQPSDLESKDNYLIYRLKVEASIEIYNGIVSYYLPLDFGMPILVKSSLYAAAFIVYCH